MNRTTIGGNIRRYSTCEDAWVWDMDVGESANLERPSGFTLPGSRKPYRRNRDSKQIFSKWYDLISSIEGYTGDKSISGIFLESLQGVKVFCGGCR